MRAHPDNTSAVNKLNHTILKCLLLLIILQRNFAQKSVQFELSLKKSSVEKGYQMGSLPSTEEVSPRKRLLCSRRQEGSGRGIGILFPEIWGRLFALLNGLE